MGKGGFAYIMTNEGPTLYVGVTNNLVKRVYEHKNNTDSSFTARYNIHKLVYYEYLDSIESAIIREKQIKDMNRIDKLTMIRSFDPGFKDLYNAVIEAL